MISILMPIPIILFVFAASFGLTLLVYVLAGKVPPKTVVILHGTCALSGLLALVFLAKYSSYTLWPSIIVFSFAALGGLYLLYKGLTGKTPKSIAVMHGVLAVIGLVLLILAVLNFY